MKTNKTIKEAIGKSKEIADLRNGETMIPPPNYDIALTLYERNPDGTDADEAFLSFGFRPQDFAVNEHMKYTNLGVLKNHEREGKQYQVAFLVHLYWDGSRDEESAIKTVLEASHMFGYGLWRPTAPSDPLMVDDFWNEETLGEPPNGYWNEETENNNFKPFNNFERKPYKKINFN